MANEQTKPSDQPEMADLDINATDATTNEADVVNNEPSTESEVSEEAALIADLEKQLVAAQEEAASLKDQMLRAAADVQNARRRAEQDVEKAHKFGTEKFAAEMLPIIDSLERALEACKPDDEATKALRDGVEMTYGMFVSGLAKFNVEQVNPEGESFNPELHQAMSMIDVPDAQPNTVVGVMQKGYSLNGRLIRPAMVMVAKG
ncbi:nucleotide exchange factor GrpE [Neptunomonas concharum]|uniref:Protein GrpE n=2 Tax=Neptunomonas concharum TaxID=1031538 RepID=A0A5P1R7S7_9GAMM|nr:nucleotide exchange factor GrpE [Neptunomonas concharum]QEQ95613.1 nucleotide exchange factor GrpE [Neptunomonas concharum]